MPKIRVLIVDDSALIRKIVGDILSAEAGIEVAGTASNGRLALAKFDQITPDLITLDVEMPEMDGLETLAEIRKRSASVPIIMFSILTERGASTTLDALELGATDYITKPTAGEGSDVVRNRVRGELLSKIRGLMHSGILGASPSPKTGHTNGHSRPPSTRSSLASVQLIAVGVSTGGPKALETLIPRLPKTLPVPVVLVQHMPPVFTRLLAERLNQHSQLTVREGAPGHSLEAGTVWIAPGDSHMTVAGAPWKARIEMNHGAPENSCRPAVDVLFKSAAQVFGAGTLGVVLTGMGSDGTRGCEQIREAGGQVIIQDEASSVVWGMPGSVFKAGLADQVVPLDQMADLICRRAAKLAQSHALKEH